MADNKQPEKKENPILLGSILLICGGVMLAMRAEYNLMLFGFLEIPLWIPGIIACALGALRLVNGIKEKNAKKENTPEE